MPIRNHKLKLLCAAEIISTELSDALADLSPKLQAEAGNALEKQNPLPPPYNGSFITVPESKPAPFRNRCSVPDSKLVKYLLASFLYYEHDYSPISDAEYDSLCRELLLAFESLTHWAKELVDKESLRAGTGFCLVGHMPEALRKQAIYWKETQGNS